MPLIPMSPEEVSGFSSQGQVSYDICKEFLAAGIVIAKVDPNDFPGHRPTAISSSLNAYIRRHELPMKNTYRKGDVILFRTDRDENGEVDKRDIDDYVDSTFQLPAGKAGPELVGRSDIPTLSVDTARRRLAEENESPE
jgi:hypothetical protein